MSETISGIFRQQQPVGASRIIPSNLEDPFNMGVYLGTIERLRFRSGWTPGASIIEQIEAAPKLENPWTIAGWSISYTAYYQILNVANAMGRPGKLIGGLVRNPTPTREFSIEEARSPWEIGTTLPIDGTLTEVIWNGEPLFRNATATTRASSSEPPLYSANFALPQPIKLNSGETLGIGMWFSPSLFTREGSGFTVQSARWSINYNV